jgi:hypothetical protein
VERDRIPGKNPVVDLLDADSDDENMGSGRENFLEP